MRNMLPFRTRLLLSFWVILALSLLFPSWYYYSRLTSELLADARQSATRQLTLLNWLMQKDPGTTTIGGLQSWLVETGTLMDSRITYLDSRGRVLSDSQVTPSEIPSLENYSGRPEIIQAQNEGVGTSVRESRLEKREQIFSAIKVSSRGDVPAGFLRLAHSSSDVKILLERLRSTYFLVVLLVFLAASLLCIVLIKRLREPIRAVTRVAEAIAAENYKKRIRFSPDNEFYPLAESMNLMAEKLEACSLSMREEKSLLEAIFNSMREGVMVLDSRGRIRSFNKSLTAVIPNPANALGRRPLEVLINLELQEICDTILESGVAAGSQSRIIRIDFPLERSFSVSISPLEMEGEEGGVLIVFTDVSEIRRLQTIRRDFVANVSRELRGPLELIRGEAERLISYEPSGGGSSPGIGLVRDNTERMLRLVDDLLQLATLESNRVDFNSPPTQAAEALAAAWDECRESADIRRIRIESQIPTAGLLLKMEFGQLVQLFRRLLDNAIRHSPEDETILVSFRQHGPFATLCIQNNGPEIPKQHKERIFERFYRAEEDMGGMSGHTGIGLAICRHLVGNYGGKIWVESPCRPLDKGAAFCFSLEAAKSA